MKSRFARLLENLFFRSAVLATLLIISAFFVIRPDIHGRLSDHTSEKADEGEHRERDKIFFGLSPEGWTAVGTFGLLGATIALFVATYALFDTAARESDKAKEALEIARISAEASNRSAQIASEQVATNRHLFALDQRPWLSVSVTPSHDIVTFNGANQATINLVVELRNTGKTPAIRIFENPALTLVHAPQAIHFFDGLREAAKMFASERTIGLTVFPGQVERFERLMIITQEEMEAVRTSGQPCLFAFSFVYLSSATLQMHETSRMYSIVFSGFSTFIPRSAPEAANRPITFELFREVVT